MAKSKIVETVKDLIKEGRLLRTANNKGNTDPEKVQRAREATGQVRQTDMTAAGREPGED